MEKVCGIYRLVCVKNGDYYYGSAKDVHVRWRTHTRTLNRGIHFNPRVQRVWNKYGEQSFRMELVETVPEQQLLEIEDKYLKEHVGKPHCMNIAKYATAINRGRTFVCSESTKKKIGDANRGKPLSEEHKAALREAAKGRPRRGAPTEVTRRKMSDAQKGKPRLYDNGIRRWILTHPQEYREKCKQCGLKLLGRKLTDEHRRKQAAGVKKYHTEKNARLRIQQAQIYKRLQSKLGRIPWKLEWRAACKEESVSTEISRNTSPFTSWKKLKEFAGKN